MTIYSSTYIDTRVSSSRSIEISPKICTGINVSRDIV